MSGRSEKEHHANELQRGDLFLALVDESEESQKLIWKWRMDPEVRKASFSPEEEAFDLFSAMFRSRYFQAAHVPPVFVVYRGRKIGLLRFRPFQAPHAYEISIILDPEFRGKGMGCYVLHMGEEYAHRQGVHKLYAYIRAHNKRSKHLFQKLGYSFVGETSHRSEGYSFSSRGSADEDDVVERYVKTLVHKDQSGGQSLFIIAEIGSNWIIGNSRKNKEMAIRLMECAYKAGCNAVKFQTYRASETYAPSPGKSAYLLKNGIDRDIGELLYEHEMNADDLPFLAETAQKMDLEFMSSAFSESTFYAVDPYVKRHKIASYEISDPVLLDCTAKSKKPIILSTGASDMFHIAWAVDRLRKQGVQDLTLLQCTSTYPASPSSMNLYAIQTLQTAFQCPVGLSDHSQNSIAAPVMAVAMGASVIEKHITLSRALPGPDHAFALEPSELVQMVHACRMAEAMRGDGRKRVLAEEEELFLFAQRALQATRDIAPGEEIRYGENAAFLRPGANTKGAHPKDLPLLDGRKVCRGITRGSGIGFNDIEQKRIE